MKRILSIILLSVFVSSAHAQLLYEPFNYTPDATNGLAQQSGGVWIRLNTGDSILVTANSLTYAGLPASVGNKVAFDGGGSEDYRTYTAQLTGSVYYSFILNVSSLGGLTTTGGYFTGLIQAGSTTSYGATIWTRASTTAGKYNIGISTRSSTSPISWLAADLNTGQSYFVVGAYDIISGTANDVARIWLNTSAIGGAEPPADATAVPATDLSTAGVGGVLLRQDNTTNTPFIELDELRIGTTWAQVTPSGAVPTLTISSPLAAFGNICINTTAGPNSFTISGTDLTTANVTVAALPGFTYSTTSGGTYTSTLSIPQSGGTFSQQVFVKFTPTAVQSYSGNIVVGGGGASNVNAAASGAGVNSAPTVTTGGTANITLTSADASGTINSIGCSPITAYGIEYSTTNGFPNGSGTQVPSSNLSGGNFSSSLTGLANGTVYYYKAYATNSGGTSYGSQQSFTTLTPLPSLSASALTAFGNTCINTVAGPNSFTISGSNLTSANVTVSSLAGYTFSTTSGGTYTSSLSLVQPGGTYSQQIFVKFSPTAVQSYNGNIVVGGGGASSINVVASGAGVNTAPSVTTGASSAITQTTATAAGSITATGCSAITAYGIEYSTVNGFVNGSGTQVLSGNLSGGNFSSNLSGLTPSTTYYYKAFATNGGGTTYGSQQSFTTATPVLTATALTAFGSSCINSTVGPNSFTITGVGLTNAPVTVGPLAGFSFSTTAGGTYTNSLSLTQPGGAYSQQIFVKFNPVAVQSYNGNIPVSGGGATAISVAASGSGVNSTASVITGTATDMTNHSATLNGNLGVIGCSPVTSYGIELSGVNGFVNGTGQKYPATNLSPSGFSVNVDNLVQGATYYFKAYAINSGGISYGAQQPFTLPAIPEGFSFYPVPAIKGETVRFTMNNVKPGYYGLLFYNSAGSLVFQKNMNIQAAFINQSFIMPYGITPGIYTVRLVNELGVIATRSITIF